jgi:phage virion morphogenesis protein
MTRADRRQLLDGAGAVLESSARRRIQSDKRGPDGERWPNWSESYAQTRHAGHSLLSAEGHLLDSIRAEVRGDEVEVGTNLVYGAVQQFGGDEVGMAIPARPYLGVSTEDERDILAVADAWADDLLGDLR